MRARPVVLLTAGLMVVAAACSDSSSADGDRSKVDTDAPAAELAAAVRTVQSDLPVALPRSSVEVLLEDLCALDPSAPPAVASQLAPLDVDAAQAQQVLDALDGGTAELCPQGVDGAARSAAEAALISPATTTTGAGATAASGSGAGSGGGGTAGSRTSGATGTSGSRASSSSGSAGTSGGSSGASGSSGSSSQSSGSASAGGGNATGAGNQSSTDFSQNVTGSNGASNSTSG